IGTIIPNDPVPLAISNPNFETVVVDLMNEDDSEKFVQSVVDKNKTIDVAVLTVGGFAMGSIVETRMADMLKQYKLNFQTAYHVARPVFVQMLRQGSGRIFLP